MEKFWETNVLIMFYRFYWKIKFNGIFRKAHKIDVMNLKYEKNSWILKDNDKKKLKIWL